MSNFTDIIKNELISKGLENACCKTAALSAFLRTNGSIKMSEGFVGFEVITESEKIAEFFSNILEELFGAKTVISDIHKDKLSGKTKISFEYVNQNSLNILLQLGIVAIDNGSIVINFEADKYILENECCSLAFIKGAFLGSGSCTLPSESSKTGYHLETVFSNKIIASQYCELLAEREILAKLIERNGNLVAYLKSKESINDFLSLLECDSALNKLYKVAEERDKNNNFNRVNNCFVGNIDKTVTASVKQIKAIKIIEETVGLSALELPLQDVAIARLSDNDASLIELSRQLNITKSCINHRMRRLIEIANELSGN